MATEVINTQGIDRLLGKVKSLESINFEPLMLQWRKILEEDNRRGALAGLDGWGKPLTPVTYRPQTVKHPNLRIRKNNNLYTSHYKILTGPPLAPRGEQSRIIQNFKTASLQEGNRWVAIGSWEDILSVQDISFLPFHFKGAGRLPKRSLNHIRPQAKQEARTALRQFAKHLLKAQA